ncbi:MAG TPA: alpha/beta hydrolase [Sporichthyaceae bacterium]|jgi:pimeloyl-ACP methyl ester carboxylesterase
MTFHEVAGLRFHVERLRPSDQPPAATVVLVHGFPADTLATYYFTVAPALAAAGLDVVMYDQRGHGRTTRPESGYQLERFVEDLPALLDELGVAGPVHLVGNCFGGMVAFGTAVLYPDRVASIFAIESEPATPDWAIQLAPSLHHGRTDPNLDASIASITAEHGSHMGRLALRAARMLRTTSLARDILASELLLDPMEFWQIRCPVFAVYAADSDLIGLADSMADALPDCRTAVIADQDHFVLSGAPEQISTLILDWLAEQGVAVTLPTAAGLRVAS